MTDAKILRGAKLLDEKKPGWRSKINKSILDMGNSYNCILGQVFADDVRGTGEAGYYYGAKVLGLLTYSSYGEDTTSHYGFSYDGPTATDWITYLNSSESRPRRMTTSVYTPAVGDRVKDNSPYGASSTEWEIKALTDKSVVVGNNDAYTGVYGEKLVSRELFSKNWELIPPLPMGIKLKDGHRATYFVKNFEVSFNVLGGAFMHNPDGQELSSEFLEWLAKRSAEIKAKGGF